MVTAAVQNVRLVVAAAAARGVPPSRLLAALELDPQELIDADGRIAVGPALRAWQVAADLCDDPLFGLSVVEHLRPDVFGCLGYAIHASATVGDGLRRLARFFHVVHQRVGLALIEDGPLIRIRIAIDGEDDHDIAELRHPMECLLAAVLILLQRTTGQQLQPTAVSFRHAAPADTTAHRNRFGVVPRFDDWCTELAFEREVLQAPHLAPDATMVLVAERHLRRMLDELPRADNFTVRVRRVLIEELRLGEPTLARLAERLRTSERTLQRRLGDEGTSVHALLDELRHELSLRHLAESKETIAEISFLLGFGETRAFHRAFKRWTGSTPAAYRRTRSGALLATAAP